jgi:quinol monooxygenase YgiN
MKLATIAARKISNQAQVIYLFSGHYMPIIVAGKLIIKEGLRDRFIIESLESVSIARDNQSCEDFSVSPDLLEENRVNIFEKWHSLEALDDFRIAIPENNLFSMVESFQVNEYEIDS